MLPPNERFYNKSVFSFLRTLTTWHCPHSLAQLLLSVVQQSIDISAANLQQLVCCCGPVLAAA